MIRPYRRIQTLRNSEDPQGNMSESFDCGNELRSYGGYVNIIDIVF